jgi:hypothetical protein
MNETLPPDLPVGIANALGKLRHALADPLSAAGLKVELLERRLAAAPPDVSPLMDRVRGVKSDLADAGRLIDLLPRLGSIASETPVETAVGDLCRMAEFPVEDGPVSRRRLLLRRQASIEAIRSVVSFLRSQGPALELPRFLSETAGGLASLRIESVASWSGSSPDRLFHLPRGEGKAEELFLARCAVESDGGKLDLVEKDARLVAMLSWPLLVAAGSAGQTA